MSLNKGWKALVVLGAVSVCASGGCKNTSENEMARPPEETRSLYERLGGTSGITAVIEDFVARAAADEKVNFFRKGTAREWKPSDAEVSTLKKLLVQFVSKHTGGPQTYEGRAMKAVHQGMRITKAEFAAIAEDLKAALEKFNVGEKETTELLKIVGSTEKDIVE
jgi:hemoglobin